MNDSQCVLLDSSPARLLDIRRRSALGAVGDLKPGQRIVGLTMGQFSLIHLLQEVLKITGPADVWLSAWTMGIKDANAAGALMDAGAMTSFALLVDRSFASRQRAYCGAVQRIFGDQAIRTTRIHAKVFVVRNAKWNITVRSSMNLNSNKRIEQFDLDDNAQIADYFQAFFDEYREAMPEGPKASTAEVDAVLDQLRRGRNPFAERPVVDLSGVPMEDGPALVSWYQKTIRAMRATFPRLSSAGEAKKLGVKRSELMAALAAPQSRPALTEEAVQNLLAKVADHQKTKGTP